jgi:glutamate synthase (NADPH/NADH) small chain
VLQDDTGNVRGLRVQRMELGEPDERGRRAPVPPASSSTGSATP